MGIDFTKMLEGMLAGYRVHKEQYGVVNANDVAKKILGGYNASALTSIFTQAAMSDGNSELSESEFVTAISSDNFKKIVEQQVSEKMKLINEAQDLSENKPIDATNTKSEELLSPGTPRDHLVAEKGEEFVKEVWEPMQELANQALKYMEENNGNLEKFSFTGFPRGVKILAIEPSIYYSDTSNDTMSIVDGSPQITRQPDFAQAVIIFEYQGEKYKLASSLSTNNLAPWGNPSYNE